MRERVVVWLTGSVEQSLQVIKLVSISATLIGAYYFMAYLNMLGVSFPVDFAILPSVLLAVGIVTVAVTIIVFFYILLAGWIQTDPFDIGYAEVIHARPSGLVGHGGRAALSSIVAIYIIPYATWALVLVLVPSEKSNVYFWGLMGAYLVWALGISLVKAPKHNGLTRKKKIVLFAKLAVSMFILSFITVLSSLVYVAFLGSHGLMESWDHILLAFVSFAVLNLGVLYPIIDIKAFSVANNSAFEHGTVEPEKLLKKLYRAPVMFAVGFLILITLLPPFAGFVGELPIKILGLSSTHPRVLFAAKKTAAAWPPELVAKCEEDTCHSVPVVVALDLGKYLYVRPANEHSYLYRVERVGVVDRITSQKEDNHEKAKTAGESAQQPIPADRMKTHVR